MKNVGTRVSLKLRRMMLYIGNVKYALRYTISGSQEVPPTPLCQLPEVCNLILKHTLSKSCRGRKQTNGVLSSLSFLLSDKSGRNQNVDLQKSFTHTMAKTRTMVLWFDIELSLPTLVYCRGNLQLWQTMYQGLDHYLLNESHIPFVLQIACWSSNDGSFQQCIMAPPCPVGK